MHLVLVVIHHTDEVPPSTRDKSCAHERLLRSILQHNEQHSQYDREEDEAKRHQHIHVGKSSNDRHDAGKTNFDSEVHL